MKVANFSLFATARTERKTLQIADSIASMLFSVTSCHTDGNIRCRIGTKKGPLGGVTLQTDPALSPQKRNQIVPAAMLKGNRTGLEFTL